MSGPTNSISTNSISGAASAKPMAGSREVDHPPDLWKQRFSYVLPSHFEKALKDGMQSALAPTLWPLVSGEDYLSDEECRNLLYAISKKANEIIESNSQQLMQVDQSFTTNLPKVKRIDEVIEGKRIDEVIEGKKQIKYVAIEGTQQKRATSITTNDIYLQKQGDEIAVFVKLNPLGRGSCRLVYDSFSFIIGNGPLEPQKLRIARVVKRQDIVLHYPRNTADPQMIHKTTILHETLMALGIRNIAEVPKEHSLGPAKPSMYTQKKYLGDLKKLHHMLTWDEKEQVLLDIADALEDLKKNGYAHHDVKPENIFLYKDDKGKMRAHLADFDMLCALTTKAKKIGTPHYIPLTYRRFPETAKQYHDQYSLAMTAFFIFYPEKFKEYEKKCLQKTGMPSMSKVFYGKNELIKDKKLPEKDIEGKGPIERNVLEKFWPRLLEIIEKDLNCDI